MTAEDGQAKRARLRRYPRGERPGRWLGRYRNGAAIALTAVLVLAASELVAHGLLALCRTPPIKRLIARATGKPNDLVSHYEALPYYRSQGWSRLYWSEFRRALTQTYEPYVIWRSRPFAGETINVDADGRRVTPGAECVPGALEVDLFGGSVMWGWGAPDWGTIPAYLQELLARRLERPVCVVNLGEQAYVTTQSLIRFLVRVEAGYEPDLAIFYGGVNDVLAASQNGRAVTHPNLAAIASRFESRRHPLIDWLRGLDTVRLVAAGLKTVGLRTFLHASPAAFSSERLSQEVVGAYQVACQTAERLGAARGIETHCFWQPHILSGGKRLTPEEALLATDLGWVLPVTPELRELFARTYELAARLADDSPRMHDLSRAFDDVEGPLWLDTWGHTTPEGNALIARAIADALGADGRSIPDRPSP